MKNLTTNNELILLQLKQAEEHIKFLQQINEHLGVWSNPYGLMVGVLAILFGILAMVSGYILFKQSGDHKKDLAKEKLDRKNEFYEKMKIWEKIFEDQKELISQFLSKALEDVKKIQVKIDDYNVKLDAANAEDKKVMKEKIKELESAKNSIFQSATPKGNSSLGSIFKRLYLEDDSTKSFIEELRKSLSKPNLQYEIYKKNLSE